MPGMHRARAMMLTRGKHQRLPVIDLDGKRIWDSTAIIAALEEYRPDPPLYPADPELKREALEWEDWADEEIAPRVRRLNWHYTFDDNDATVASVFPDGAPAKERMMRMTAPVAKGLVRRDYDVSQASADEALTVLRAGMDKVEEALAGGDYLVGDSFSVADLTVAALYTPLVAPPERPWAPKQLVGELQNIREQLTARPAGQWITEMYARHRSRALQPA